MNSTNDSIPTEETISDPYASRRDAMRHVYFSIMAFLVPFGLTLNILALIVLFTSTKLRRSIIGHFLIALAFADITFLTGEFLRWLNTFYDTEGHILGIDFIDNSQFWCKTIYSLRYTGQLLSAMFTVVITIQRTVCIFRPLMASVPSTLLQTKITIAVLYVIFFCLGFSGSFFIKITPLKDTPWCLYKDGFYIWYWIVIRILTMILPWVTLLILTCAILFKLRRIRKFSPESATYNRQTSGASLYQGVEKQLTTMLLLVVVAFLVLRGPYIVTYGLMQNRYTIWEPLPHHVDFKLTVINDICDCLSVLNYCINFFLYFVSASAFRRQFRRVFCKCLGTSGAAAEDNQTQEMATEAIPFNSPAAQADQPSDPKSAISH